MVLHRLSGITDGQKISYHRSCHKKITSSRNNTVTNKTNDSLKTHDTLDLLLTELQQQLFEKKQVLVLSEVCTRYEILNRQKNAMVTGEEKVRSFWLKAKLEKAFGERVIFFTQRGSPCVFCSRDVPIGLLLKDTKSFKDITKAVCVTANNQTDVDVLSCRQEEADTRLFLHLYHFDQRCSQDQVRGRAIIKSPDTDVVVLVLAIHYFSKCTAVDEVWLEIGGASQDVDHHRFLPIHDMYKVLGDPVCHVLPAAHALTGCDTISNLYGIGKISTMNILSAEDKDLAILGDPTASLEQSIKVARKFVMKLYGPGKRGKAATMDLDGLRVKLANTTDKPLTKLPPCEDVFKYHVKRVSWQARVWMTATNADEEVVSPVGCGWQKEEEVIRPIYFEGPTACEMLSDLICDCKGRNKCGGECPCSNLGCTDLCRCEGGSMCGNPFTKEDEKTVEDTNH